MTIDGFEITRFSEYDELPIKNHLPPELRDRMKTERQWLDAGFLLKPEATKYEMHPAVLSKRTFIYYLDSDVEEMTMDNAPDHKCITCSYRPKKFCLLQEAYVSPLGSCHEWCSNSEQE